MIRSVFFLLVFAFSLNYTNTYAQNTKTPCATKKYNEFNFWLGDWKVYDTQGKLIGTNTIVKKQGNCLLQENWTSKTSAGRGTSYNFVNTTDNTWNQVWISNSGFTLELKGNLIDGKMVLKSELTKGKQGEFYHQITWTPNKDHSVTQVWEYIAKDGKVLQEAFRGIYKRQTR